MDGAAIALAGRVVLAVVLVVAAVAKLREPETTRRQTIALIGAAGGVVARALPVVELAIAAVLVVWWGPVPGVVATVVLLAFSVVLVRAQVRRLPCPCFAGATRDAPVGPAGILRNGVLIVNAVLATGSPTGAGVVPAVLALVALGGATTLAVARAR